MEQPAEPRAPCYVHIDVEVEEVQEDGSFCTSGTIHFFYVQMSSRKVGQPASLKEMEEGLGFRVVNMSETHTAALLHPATERSKFFPFKCSGDPGKGPDSCFQQACCKDFGLQSITFYEKVGIVHKTFFFRDAWAKQRHICSSFSTLDRQAFRLELLVSEQSSSGLKFVASPFEVLAESWPLLLPGVAIQLHKPLRMGISRQLSTEWQLGPSPELVHGVDFSLAFSKHPLFVIPIQRRSTSFRQQILLPVFFLGITVPFLFLARDPRHDSHGGDSHGGKHIVLIGLLALILALFLLRVAVWPRKLFASRFLDTYFVLTLAGFVALLVLDTVTSVELTRGVLWTFLSVWCIFHLLLLAVTNTDIFRGTWERAISQAKLGSIVKPDLASTFGFPNGSAKARVVPVLIQTGIQNAKTNSTPSASIPDETLREMNQTTLVVQAVIEQNETH